MAGTTAFVFVLLGGCVVALAAVLAKARVEIARIQATHQAHERLR